MSVASILFTSLIIFRSLSATLSSYAESFESKMTIFIDYVASLFNFSFLKDIFRPLTNLYGFLSNVLSHINFGPVAVQCEGSQAAMELLSNCLIIITLFIIVEAEYATILQSVQDLISSYLKACHLERLFHGLDYYFHLLISVVLYVIFVEFNPVQLTVQYLASMVNIEQFYSKGFVHSYSPYCDNYPGFTNIDIFMAYSCTALTTLFIVPVVVTMLRLMIPSKVCLEGNVEALNRLEEDKEVRKVHPLVEPIVISVRRLNDRVNALYTESKNRGKLYLQKLQSFLASVKHRVPPCTFLHEKILYYDSMHQEIYKRSLVLVKPYVDPLLLRLSKCGRILTGVLTVISPDTVMTRLFIVWFSKIVQRLEYEEYLNDVTMTSSVPELQTEDSANVVHSTRTERVRASRADRVTETSREIVDRTTILERKFWMFSGKFIDDDENHAAFKADDSQKRLSFYELIKQELVEYPATSRLLRDVLQLVQYVVQYIFSKLMTLVFVSGCFTGMTLIIFRSIVGHGGLELGFQVLFPHIYGYFTIGILYVLGILYDIISVFLLGVQGIFA